MEIRTEVEIAAPPARVWAVLVDFKRYPEWNPFITSIAGTPERGATLQITLGFSDGRQVNETPTLVVVEPESELRWALQKLHRRWLHLEHFFLLRPAGDRTRLVHGANLTGFAVKLAGHTLTLAARASVGMNEALKKRVEAGA